MSDEVYSLTLRVTAGGMVAPMSNELKLDEMQAAVGGLIELVRMPWGDIWVNEEGLLMGLPLNEKVSRLVGRPIVGDALVQVDEGSTFDATGLIV